MEKIISGSMGDKHLLNYLKESTTVQQWNERREQLKGKKVGEGKYVNPMRSDLWIGKEVDASGLINLSQIPKN